jgi:hypothetical protein
MARYCTYSIKQVFSVISNQEQEVYLECVPYFSLQFLFKNFLLFEVHCVKCVFFPPSFYQNWNVFNKFNKLSNIRFPVEVSCV